MKDEAYPLAELKEGTLNEPGPPKRKPTERQLEAMKERRLPTAAQRNNPIYLQFFAPLASGIRAKKNPARLSLAGFRQGSIRGVGNP